MQACVDNKHNRHVLAYAVMHLHKDISMYAGMLGAVSKLSDQVL